MKIGNFKKLSCAILTATLAGGLLPATIEHVQADPLALEPVAAGLDAVKDYQDNQKAGKASTYYDNVYYGDVKWRVLASDADSGTGKGTLLFSDSVLNYGQAWNGYRINSDRDGGGDTTKGYLNSDIRKYLNSTGTYTSYRTGRTYGDGEVAYNYVNNVYYYQSVIEDDPGNDNDEFDKGPVAGVIYYEKDTESYEEETNELNAANFGQGQYFVKNGDSYELSRNFNASNTYYYDTSTYKEWDSTGKTSFDAGKKYYRFYVASGVPSSTAWPSWLVSTRFYVGYKINTSKVITGKDAADINFVSDYNISATEKAAVVPATKTEPASNAKYMAGDYSYYGGSMENDTYFLLSAKEANSPEYGLNLQVNRVGKRLDAPASAANWWLRASAANGSAGIVNSGGAFGGANTANNTVGVRPAFYLNPTSVILASAAAGGKSAAVGSNFSEIAASDTQDWKLTLKDSTLDVMTSNTQVSGNRVTVDYSGATTTGDNVYVSAIVTDGAGKNIYGYTKLAKVDSNAAKSGTVTMELPVAKVGGTDTQLNLNNCKVKVFLEKCNGDNKTDYASEPKAINTPVCSTHDFSDWDYGDDFDCAAGGTRTRYCLKCGHEESEEYTGGHDLVRHAKIEKECDKGNGGVEEHWECTICGKLFRDAAGTQEVSYNDLLINETHNRVTKWYPASTSSDASRYPDIVDHYHYRKVECDVCGTVTNNYQGRFYWEAHTGVDCEHGGTCTKCGQVVTGGSHTFNTYDTTTFVGYKPGSEPTCTQKGVGLYKCIICGQTGETEVAALGHLYSGKVKVKTETYDSEGYEYRYCTRCGEPELTPVTLIRENATIVIDGPIEYTNITGSPVTAGDTGSPTFTFTHSDGSGTATGLFDGTHYNATVKWYSKSGTTRTELGSAPSAAGSYSLGVSADIANTTELDDNGNPEHSYNAVAETFYDFTIKNPSGSNYITSFTVDGQEGQTQINHTTGEIVFYMPYGTDPSVLTSLTPSDVQVSTDATITTPATPTETPLDYTGATGGVEYVVQAQDSTTRTYFVKGYIADAPTPKVRFETNGGSYHAPRTVTYGEPYGDLPEATKTNFVFEGWFADADLTQQVTASTEVTTKTDHTLYAKFRALLTLVPNAATPQTHTATGSGISFIPSAEIVETTGSLTTGFKVYYKPEGAGEGAYTETAPSAPGTYDVKYTRVKDDTYLAMVPDGTGKLVIEPKAAETEYTFDYNGGKLDGKFKSVLSGKQGDPVGVIPVPVWEGYTLEGWYVQGDGSQEIVDPMPDYFGNENITYVAKWSAEKHSVSFDTNGGSPATIDSIQVPFGEKIMSDDNFPSDPTKPGFDFGGWMNGADKLLRGDTMGTSDVALVASWNEKSGYTVNYNTRGGSEVTPKSDVKWTDTNLVPATDPTKATFTFAGWETDKGTPYTGDMTYGSVAVSDKASITLYANWTAKTYTVKYDTDGGDTIADKTVSWSDSRLAPASATRTGYVLEGWYINAEKTEKLSTTTKYSDIAANESQTEITLYANWLEDKNKDDKPDMYQVFVTYVSADTTKGIVTPVKEPEVYTALKDGGIYRGTVNFTTEGAAATPAAGNSLIRWTNSFNSETNTTDGKIAFRNVPVGEEIVLTAEFGTPQVELTNYTFDFNGGKVGSDIKAILSGESGTAVPAAPQPVWEGHTLDGWFVYGDPTETLVTIPAEFGEEDITYIAKWSVNKYTVSFDTNGGTPATIDAIQVPYGDKIKSYDDFPADPTKAGSEFAGWEVSPGTLLKGSDTMGTSDITLTATWRDKTGGYTVNYETDGGSIIAPKTNVKWTDANLAPTTAPTKETYNFLGWKKADGTDYAATDTYGDVAGSETDSITLYAKWEAKTYTVKYNTDGGTPVADKTVGWSDKGLVPATAPTKESAVFEGWYTDAAKTQKLQSTQAYSDLAANSDTASVTVYAKWDDDANKDGKADKYQVFVQYVSADDAKGTVAQKHTPATEKEVHTAQQNTDGSFEQTVTFTTEGATNTPAASFAFNGWTNSYDDAVSYDADGKISFKNVPVGRTITITADFAGDTNGNEVPDEKEIFVEYKVDDETKAEITGITKESFFEKNADGSYAESFDFTTSGTTAAKKATADAAVALKFFRNDKNSERNLTGKFTFNAMKASGQTITVTANFGTDTLGPDTDNDGVPDPDGVPDDKEVYVQYTAGANGKVEGQKFYTFYEETDDDKYADSVNVNVTPAASLKAIPDSGYIFSKWTNDLNSTTSTNGKFNFGSQPVNSTITITANFVKVTYQVQDEEGNKVTPKPALTDPARGDVITDKQGNEYVIKDVADPDTDTGVSVVTVKDVVNHYADEEGNEVDPTDEPKDPKKGDVVTDKDDNKYVVKEVGDPDPETGDRDVTVVPVTYDYEKEDGSKVTPVDAPKNPAKGDVVKDADGNEYVVKNVGEPDADTGVSKVTLGDVTNNITDEEGNKVTPKDPVKDPKLGDTITGKDGNTYEITEVGPIDPETGNRDLKVAKVSYTFSKGDRSTWKEEKGGEHEFRVNRSINDNKTFGLFKGIKIDGTEVNAADYGAAAGSVILALKEDYMESLAAGEHTIEAMFADGSAKATFTVTKDSDTPTPVTTYEYEKPDGTKVTPVNPPVNPVRGVIVKDDKGNEYVIMSVGDKDPETGVAKVIVGDVTNKITDDKGNPVTPKDKITDPKVGDKFTGTDGKEYKITYVGPADPDTGEREIRVELIDGGKDDPTPTPTPTPSPSPVTPGKDDNKPGSNSGSGTPGKSSSKAGSAKTGDINLGFIWIILAAAAAGTIVTVAVYRKKKGTDH